MSSKRRQMKSFKFQNKKNYQVSLLWNITECLFCPGFISKVWLWERGTLKYQHLRQGRKLFLFKEQLVRWASRVGRVALYQEGPGDPLPAHTLAIPKVEPSLSSRSFKIQNGSFSWHISIPNTRWRREERRGKGPTCQSWRKAAACPSVYIPLGRT